MIWKSSKSKDKFVNQPHRNKIDNIRAVFVFLKKNLNKSKIVILNSDSSDKFLPIYSYNIFQLCQT